MNVRNLLQTPSLPGWSFHGNKIKSRAEGKEKEEKLHFKYLSRLQTVTLL